jgi:hypothetical protein
MKSSPKNAAPRMWLMLVHKIPRDPTAARVHVWRKLKQLGATMLQDAVWVLPENARTREQFQWLAAEINELGGESTVWQSSIVEGSRDDALVREFTERVDEEYRQILAALRRKSRDLPALARRFREACEHDYFHSELGRRTRDALATARGDAAL